MISNQPDEKLESDRVKELIEVFNKNDVSSIDTLKASDIINGLTGEEVQKLKENKAFMKNLETIFNQPESRPTKHTAGTIFHQSQSTSIKELKNVLIEKLFPMQAIEATIVSSDESVEDSNLTPSTDEKVGDDKAFNQNVAQQLNFKIDITDASDDDRLFETPIVIDRQKPTREEIINKRQLSEIKPIIKPSKGLYEAENKEVKPIYKASILETKYQQESVRIMIETEDSEDTDTSSDILKRNLEILRRKTSEKRHQSGNIMTEEAIDIDISQIEQKRIVPQVHNQRFNYQTVQKDDLDSNIQPPPSYVTSHSMKNIKSLKPAGLSLSKIKIMKKSNDEISCSEEDSIANQLQKGTRSSLSNRGRSISPTLLRAQDIIETIETTTSMSYITSKTVDLIYEERKIPPKFSSVSSISQNDAYNTYIKQTEPQLAELNAVSVPIIVQTRSKSESLTDKRRKPVSTTEENDYNPYTPSKYKAQRLDAAGDYLSAPIATTKIHVSPLPKNRIPVYDDHKTYLNQQNYESSSNSTSPNRPFPYTQLNTQQGNRQNYVNVNSGSDSGLATSFSTHHGGKNYEVYGSSPRSQVSFHKFDSNEIIAVVKVPASGSDDLANVEKKKWLKSKSEANLAHLKDENLGLYEPFTNFQDVNDIANRKNINNKLDLKLQEDRWKTWPEYTVDQETEKSFVTTNEINKNIKPVWVKNIENDTRSMPNLKKSKPGSQMYSNVEFEIEVEKRPPNCNTMPTTTVSIDGQPSRAKVSTAKDGRVSIQNIVGIPGNEITIQSDVHTEDPKTRMSSGYFSGEEFHAGRHSSRAAQRKTQLENFYNFENSNVNQGDSNFNVNKFIHKKNKQNWDAIEELDNLYKSLGLEDEALLDRANARDYKLYGNLKESDYENYGNEQYYENVNSSVPYERKSLYSRKSAMPDTVSDDMARRKTDENQSKYYTTEYSNNQQLDNKRSNSVSSLPFSKYPNDILPNQLIILPSPTSADYLRNRTRENALYDVVGKNPPDTELSQILYDDMAYRQLRKDTDVVKPLLNKQTVSFSATNLTGDRNKNKNTSSYDHIDNFASNLDYSQNNNFSNPVNNYSNNNNNYVKTVKMVKQKDATKSFKRDSSNIYFNTQQLGLTNK